MDNPEWGHSASARSQRQRISNNHIKAHLFHAIHVGLCIIIAANIHEEFKNQQPKKKTHTHKTDCLQKEKSVDNLWNANRLFYVWISYTMYRVYRITFVHLDENGIFAWILCKMVDLFLCFWPISLSKSSFSHPRSEFQFHKILIKCACICGLLVRQTDR